MKNCLNFRRLLIYCLFFFDCHILVCQYSFGLNYLGGQLISHTSYTKSIESPVYGCQLESLWKLRQERDDLTSSKNDIFHSPQLGFSVTWMNMGHVSTGFQMASALVLGGVISNKGSLSFNYHFSHGLSFLSQKYDTNQRPINFAIGSHMNYFAQLKSGFEYNLTDNLNVNASLYLTHASNGNWKKPNVGLNALHYGIGVVYFPNEISNKDRNSMYLHKKKFFAHPYLLGIKFGIREHSLEFRETFTTWIFDFQYRIQKNARHIWDIGLDVFSDPNYKFDKFGKSTNSDDFDLIELGVKGGHQFLFGRVSLRTDLGVYILKPIFSEKPYFYNAVGIEYRISQEWLLRSRLKAHLNVADYMEFGVARLF